MGVAGVAFAVSFVLYMFAAYALFPGVPFMFVYISFAVFIVGFSVHRLLSTTAKTQASKEV